MAHVKESLQKGLQLVLDAHSDQISGGTVSEDFNGFYAVIDSSYKFPTVMMKTVLIRAGHNNFVSMSATKITSNDIKHIDPKYRKCYFSGDRNMTVHRNYTQANCMLECQLTYGLSKVCMQVSLSAHI